MASIVQLEARQLLEMEVQELRSVLKIAEQSAETTSNLFAENEHLLRELNLANSNADQFKEMLQKSEQRSATFEKRLEACIADVDELQCEKAALLSKHDNTVSNISKLEQGMDTLRKLLELANVDKAELMVKLTDSEIAHDASIKKIRDELWLEKTLWYDKEVKYNSIVEELQIANQKVSYG